MLLKTDEWELQLSEGCTKKLKAVAKCDDLGELRQMLQQEMAAGVEAVICMAALVRRMDELGDDLSWFVDASLPLYRMVAHGQIMPQLVTALLGNPAVLQKAIALPIAEQRRIASNEPLEFYRPDGSHFQVRPAELSQAEIRQLFNGQRVRNRGEQLRYLAERAERAAKTAARKVENDVHLDRKGRFAVIAGIKFTLKDLARMVDDLAG